MESFTIRYAKTNQDIDRIFEFTSAVSGPVRFCKINAVKAHAEIGRVVLDPNYGFALMAEINGEIVGTLGVIAPEWWYGDDRFFTDRWFFLFPVLANKGVGTALLAEAAAVAAKAGVPLIINGKPRVKNSASAGPTAFMSHTLIEDEPRGVSH
jgi:GNAT superfamily N-acetyltransferase